MGEIWKLFLDSVKWLTSLRTAAQQLVAGLFLLVGFLMGTIVFLYRQNITDRERYEARELIIRKEAKEEIAKERLKTDAAMEAAKKCMVEKFDMVSQLLVEQKALNREQSDLISTSKQIANANKKLIPSIKKDAEKLVKQATQTRRQ